MPLPTTNLTAHFDSSTNAKLWQNWQAGSPFFNTAVNDGDPVGYWEDEQVADLSAESPGNDSTRPVWRSSSTGLPLPCIDFDGSNDSLGMFNDAGTVAKDMSDIVTSSAYTVLLSIYIESVTANNANPWDNECIWSEDGQFLGLFLRIDTGQPILQLYNFDGGVSTLEVNVSLNTSYVVMCRHQSGVLYLSINGGSESSLVSGATTTLTGTPRLGRHSITTGAVYNGRIGEIAFYNAALTGSDLSDAISYFSGRWLEAAPPAAGLINVATTGMRW